MVKIYWPGQVPMLRKIEDFDDEYQEEYLSKF